MLGASNDYDMRSALREFQEGPCFAKVVDSGHAAAKARLGVIRDYAVKT